jgi:hypothetical protein
MILLLIIVRIYVCEKCHQLVRAEALRNKGPHFHQTTINAASPSCFRTKLIDFS